MSRSQMTRAKAYAQYLATVTKFYEDEMVDIVLRHHKITEDDAWKIVGDVLDDLSKKAGEYTIDVSESETGHRSFNVVCPDGRIVEGFVNWQQAIGFVDYDNIRQED